MTRKVAIFMNQHLPLSEVFIYHQAQSLRRFTPTFVACRQVRPSVEHSIPTHILNTQNSLPEKISETLFKLSGHSPFLKQHIQGHDIIHAHFGPTGWLAAPLAKQTKTLLVVTLHGFDVLKNKDQITLQDDGIMQVLYKQFLSRLTNQASQFICVSEYLKKRAIEFGFPEEKCVVNYMGIPLTPFTEPKILRTDKSSPFRILSVGRLVPMKGHQMLIEAVAAVQQAGYNVQLDIVGAGPLREALEKQASNSLKNFKFWGGQPHTQILSLMRQSDIFAHLSHQTSNGYNEAFGLAVIEAQWAGLPVVAFRSGGVPEGIAENQTGILCPENDVQAVRNAICDLIDNDQKRNEMSSAAPYFIQNAFDSANLTDRLEGIYDQTILKFPNRRL